MWTDEAKETENGDEDTWLFLPFKKVQGAGGIFLSVLVSWVKGEEEQKQQRATGEHWHGALVRLCVCLLQICRHLLHHQPLWEAVRKQGLWWSEADLLFFYLVSTPCAT